MTSGGQGIRSGSKGQTRDRIVHAVIDALHDEGVAGISMPSTAARAQMSVRTLYRYFPSREALLAAPLEPLLENVQPDMAVETARDLPVAFVEMADRLTRHPELANIVAGIGREVDL